MTEEADYVIVGGGTAGCVLAARLSEGGRHRVALLEAGGEDDSFWIRAPLGFGRLYDDPRYNWRYEGEPEAGLDGARPFLPRGKVLGGTGSINGLIHSPAHRSDFDLWRDLGNAGWSYDEVLPFFDKARAALLGTFAHDDQGDDARQSNLPRHALADAFIAGAGQAGFAAGMHSDRTDEDTFAYNLAAIRNGRRSSSATAYLHPARSRPNLRVLLHATAKRIVFEGARASEVEYTCGGQTRSIKALREVIVAGGTYNSPALLQRSGIGPQALLQAHAIPWWPRPREWERTCRITSPSGAHTGARSPSP